MGRGAPPPSRGGGIPSATRGAPPGIKRLPGTKAERAFIAEHKGGSFLGRYLSDAYHTAYTAPAGIYAQVAAPVHDITKSAVHLVTGPGHQRLGHDPLSRKATKLLESDYQTPEVAKQMAVGTYETARHPLRHPFQTTLLLGAAVNPILGGGMRGAAGLRAAAEVEGVGSKIHTFAIGAAEKPVYVRILSVEGKYGPITARAQAFRSPIGIASQKLMDKARARFPEGPISRLEALPRGAGRAAKARAVGEGTLGVLLSPTKGGLRQKIAFENHERRRILDSIAESPAAVIQSLGETFTEGQQAALYVVGIGKNIGGKGDQVFLKNHIAYHQRMIDIGEGSAKGHQNWINWLKDAEQYIGTNQHGSFIKKEYGDLRKASDLMHQLGYNRESLWGDLGVLSPEDAAIRRAHPGQEILYGGKLPAEKGGQGALFHEASAPDIPAVGGGLPRPLMNKEELAKWMAGEELRPIEGPLPRPEQWTPAEMLAKPFTGGGPRIPELGAHRARTAKQRLRAFIPGPGRKEHVPETLTHEYHAALLRSGQMRPMFTQFMAEAVVEAERFGALLRGRGQIQSLSHTGEKGRFDVPMNIGALKEGNADYQAIFDKLNANIKLDANETRKLGVAYEFYRQRMFPSDAHLADAKNFEMRHYQTLGGQQAQLRVEQLGTANGLPDGWAWVDRRDLAGLEKMNPQIAKPVQRAAGALVDAINDASRLAFIYLKLGYIPANLLGNVAMNIVQAGFSAPMNLHWAATVDKRLGSGKAVMIDRIMGLGISSLSRSSTHALHDFSTWVAEKQSRIIDRVPRRAAFYHEARKAGMTEEDIGAFLDRTLKGHAPSEEEMLVIRNAKEAIGDYERLGSFEKSIIRRIVFFYPWLKVSTRMTGRTLIEYPYKSAAIGQTAQLGRERQQEAFGIPDMPAGYEGLIPVGGGNVVDPRAISIWSTPADIGRAAVGLTQGNLPPAYSFSQFGTPLVGAALAGLTHQNAFGRPLNESTLRIMWNEMGPQIPSWRAIKKSFWDDTERQKHLYPQSPEDVWAQWATSGWRGHINPAILQDMLDRQQRGR